MLLVAGMLLAAQMNANGPVKVRGEVLAASAAVHAVTITVMGEEGDTLQVYESWNGRFRLRLPEERVITLRFAKPGCRDKEVVIDTHHALERGSQGRKVDFGVELEPTSALPMRYAGAVGTIAFAPGTGRLAVQRHYALVREF